MALNIFSPPPIKEPITNNNISWLSWFTAIWNILKYLNFGFGNPTFKALKGSLYIKLDASTSTDRLWINSTGSTTWVYITTSA